MYLTFDEFEEMGGKIDEASFPRLEHKARAMIDLMTYGRVAGETPVRDAVKYACFDLIQAMGGSEVLGGTGQDVASVSNDGVSITYAGGVSAETRYKRIVRSYLATETTRCGIPLTYAGVDA